MSEAYIKEKIDGRGAWYFSAQNNDDTAFSLQSANAIYVDICNTRQKLTLVSSDSGSNGTILAFACKDETARMIPRGCETILARRWRMCVRVKAEPERGAEVDREKRGTDSGCSIQGGANAKKGACEAWCDMATAVTWRRHGYKIISPPLLFWALKGDRARQYSLHPTPIQREATRANILSKCNSRNKTRDKNSLVRLSSGDDASSRPRFMQLRARKEGAASANETAAHTRPGREVPCPEERAMRIWTAPYARGEWEKAASWWSRTYRKRARRCRKDAAIRGAQTTGAYGAEEGCERFMCAEREEGDGRVEGARLDNANRKVAR
ncbi:hypothetical protein DFH09DRAFT_1098918 [Mycena vulgaris]|nr:hypothetical protein DFH09DRAFT_1098918 [Mycena vulgaris]